MSAAIDTQSGLERGRASVRALEPSGDERSLTTHVAGHHAREARLGPSAGGGDKNVRVEEYALAHTSVGRSCGIVSGSSPSFFTSRRVSCVVCRIDRVLEQELGESSRCVPFANL